MRRWAKDSQKDREAGFQDITFDQVDHSKLWDLPWDPEIKAYLKLLSIHACLIYESNLHKSHLSRKDYSNLLDKMCLRVERERSLKDLLLNPYGGFEYPRDKVELVLQAISRGLLDDDKSCVENKTKIPLGIVGHGILDGVVTDLARVSSILSQLNNPVKHFLQARITN